MSVTVPKRIETLVRSKQKRRSTGTTDPRLAKLGQLVPMRLRRRLDLEAATTVNEVSGSLGSEPQAQFLTASLWIEKTRRLVLLPLEPNQEGFSEVRGE